VADTHRPEGQSYDEPLQPPNWGHGAAPNNHLTENAVPRLFATDPIIQRVLPLLRVEQFFDGR